MKKIFVDFDNTIIDSMFPFCATYNELYCGHPNFVPADPDLVTTWNAAEQIPLCSDINELFGHHLFFEFAKPLDEYTIPVLEKLSKHYELIICSIGVPANISKKAKYIEKHFTMIHQSVLLMQNNCKMDKSIVHMGSDSIFIDDVVANLDSSDAGFKICIGKEYQWNRNAQYVRCKTWKDIGNILL